MKRIMILATIVLTTGIYSNVYSQRAPNVSTPATTGDKNLRDTDIKTRSTDLERVERDANKTDTPANNSTNDTSKAEDKLAAKYEEIKADFEQIQLSQDAVIKAYQTGGKIDYAQISKSAQEINKSAVRLNSNLFSTTTADEKNKEKKEEKKKGKTEKAETKPVKSVRDLIIELDNTIGSFAASPMFQNLRVVDPKVSEKAKLDLEKIIQLSALLDVEARKMDTTGK